MLHCFQRRFRSVIYILSFAFITPAVLAEPLTNPSALVKTANKQAAVPELKWEDLIPKEWHPDSDLVFKYNNGEIGDDDPRIIALKKKLQEMERLAPVNKTLNGKRIKLPGFALPLETDGKTVSEFLLLPYHGACIHVPPPPANQIVLVKTRSGTEVVRENFDTVMVTGILKIEKSKSDVAESGYTLQAEKIESYQ